jgi:CheY-like chemotaxis protein/anti-sigma regulatory factor (Ser/Thr protein kinase)
MEELDDALGTMAVQKALYLHWKIDGLIPQQIHSDPTKFKQILINIIGNAIKFTDKGGVEVTFTFTPQKKLGVLVRDTGPGLTAAEADSLFRAFTQVDMSSARRFGGAGLGLVLSRALAKALGGDVIIKTSKKNQGSTFEITVDPGDLTGVSFISRFEKPSRAQVIAKGPDIKLDSAKVLLVDDSKDLQFLVSRFLKAAGAQVETAANGREGVEKALSGEYDIVLMDMQMPVMDGLAATKLLRSKGFRKPIIALTAHALKEERTRCLAAGCDDHVIKPIQRTVLLERIRHFVHSPTSTRLSERPL